MAGIQIATFFNFFIFLLIPFIFGYIFRRVNISPIIGYITGGIVLGNVAPQLVSHELVQNFAYVGIVLLLFTVGLELNVTKLFILKKIVVIGGLLQIAISLIAISVLSSVFGFNYLQAFLIGIALTSSSTSVVAKIIQDRGEEHSYLGEIAIGILMFQDLAFIPFIIIFTHFNTPHVSWVDVIRDVTIGIFESAAILFLMYYAGKRLIPLLFNQIAQTSRELLNLFIIVFIFMVIALSSQFGIPVLVGAFIAGVLVSHTLEHFHVFSQIRPLRDIMAIIFFVYIGTHVQISEVVFSLPLIVWYAFLLVAVKAFIFLGILLYFRFSTKMAFSVAILLMQVSENAFILLSLAFSNKIFSSQEYLFVISAILLSIMFTPILINNRDLLYMQIRKFIKKFLPPVESLIRHRVDFDQQPLESLDLKNHVVICGYGRIGEQIGKALMFANIPFVAIDYNFHTVERMKKEGISIIYGDPTDTDVLDFAKVAEANAIVLAIPSRADQESIILHSKKKNPQIAIISRVHTDKDRQRIQDLGVQAVILPEFEASLSVIRKLFLLKRMSRDDSAKLLRHIKLVRGMG